MLEKDGNMVRGTEPLAAWRNATCPKVRATVGAEGRRFVDSACRIGIGYRFRIETKTPLHYAQGPSSPTDISTEGPWSFPPGFEAIPCGVRQARVMSIPHTEMEIDELHGQGGYRKQGATYLDQLVPHSPQFEKPLFICADEQYCHFIRIALFSTFRSLVHLLGRPLQVEEADVHVQVAGIVETRETERNPVLSAAGLHASSFEEHVEDEVKVSRMQTVFLWPDHGNESPRSDNEAIEQVFGARLQQGVVDDIAMRFAELETFESGEKRRR